MLLMHTQQDSRLRRLERAIHFLDIENLTGTSLPQAHEVEVIKRAYGRAVPVGANDLVIMATSHLAAPAAWWGWPEARRLVRSGPNGADLALLHAIETEDVAARFSRVVIGSGDGIFAEACARLQAAGCQLIVVTRAKSLSRALRFAVRDVRLIDGNRPVAPPALVLPDRRRQVRLDELLIPADRVEATG